MSSREGSFAGLGGQAGQDAIQPAGQGPGVRNIAAWPPPSADGGRACWRRAGRTFVEHPPYLLEIRRASLAERVFRNRTQEVVDRLAVTEFRRQEGLEAEQVAQPVGEAAGAVGGQLAERKPAR
jgi:hypothetical protein